MDRRKFLWLGSAAISTIAGCQWANPFDRRDRLRVTGLLGALPSKIVDQFEAVSNLNLEYKAENMPAKLWQELQNYAKLEPNLAPQVSSIGDGWLDQAIAQSLIQPISSELLSKIPQWQQLPTLWQQSVTRGQQVWAIPYRWGTTAIAYRGDKLKFEISKWSDLWRPELKGKLTLPDDAREVIGLGLKKLGQSYQLENIGESQDLWRSLTQDLKNLHSQVLTYTSDNYLQALLTDDSFVAVGWTSDMYKAKRQNPNLKVVIPQEGTALWSDVWVIPRNPANNSASNSNNQTNQTNRGVAEWIDFCLSPAIAAQITALTDAISPVRDLSQVPDSVKADPIKFFAADTLAKSELILPLSEASNQEYVQLWTKLRSGNL